MGHKYIAEKDIKKDTYYNMYQIGAGGARWAHNPKAGRSKLPSDKIELYNKDKQT